MTLYIFFSLGASIQRNQGLVKGPKGLSSSASHSSWVILGLESQCWKYEIRSQLSSNISHHTPQPSTQSRTPCHLLIVGGVSSSQFGSHGPS